MTSVGGRWVRFADRHRRPLLLACLGVAIAGAWGSARLFGDLRPDVSELLPGSSPSAVAAREVARRFGGTAELTVVLSGADLVTLELFADDLAARLAAAPGDLVRWVDYRVDEQLDFFRPRLLLFATKAELERLRDALTHRIEWERSRPDRRAVEPPDVEAVLRDIAKGREDLLGRFPSGYYAGEVEGERPGEKMTLLAMIVRLGNPSEDFAKVSGLLDLVRSEVAGLEPAKYAPGLTVAYGGYVASNVREHDALAEDLVWATLLVVLAVALAVAVYNRTWKAIFAVGLPLVTGTLATFGLADLWIGHLNSNTAFLGSIVVGNGINVGLVFFARYLEERRRGKAPADAMTRAVEGTWLATLTAALAAGASYGSLLSTDFRGFNQFGLIGGVGMALSWLFAYAMTPPLVLAWEARRAIPRLGQRSARPIFTHAVSVVIGRYPRTTAAAAALATLLAALGLARASRDPVEYDFRKLRDASALRFHGTGWWDGKVDELFGQHLAPTVILARDEAEAREVVRKLEAHLESHPGSTFGSVLGVASFVPDGQAEKLPVVNEIRALATPENLAFLPPDRRAAVKAVLPPADLATFGAADLPQSIRRQLTETSGQLGTPVILHPSGRIDVWNGRDVERFAAELRSVGLPASVPVASSLLVFADVLDAIERDGPRATLLSLAGVVALVVVAFGAGKRTARSLQDAGWVLASLAVGVVWFGGLAGALGLRLNMLNFIALPITFGIGVDYATNIFQRRRLEHAHSITEAVRTTGGAVTLCSLTTIIGYASLLVARNQALQSFGVLAVLGEVACLAAALLALPALLRWRELDRRPPATAEGSGHVAAGQL